MIYRSAVIAQGDAILVKDLPAEIRGGTETAAAPVPAAVPEVAAAAPAEVRASPGVAGSSLPEALDQVFEQLTAGGQPLMGTSLERAMIERALKADGGDHAAAAAKRLGITKAALQKKQKPPAT